MLKIRVLKMVILICWILLFTIGISQMAYALGDYNYSQTFSKVPFTLEDKTEGTIVIGFEVYRFHDRIIEVPDETEDLMLSAINLNEYEIVDYRISVRKKDDYTVVVSGVVQVRTMPKTVTGPTNKYYYKTIRVYEEVS